MTAWLLLKHTGGEDRGEAVALQPLVASLDVPVSDPDRLAVLQASFNGNSAGDAARSVKLGGTVALRLLARQYRGVWTPSPLRRLSVETRTPLSGWYDGRSGDLLYALSSYFRLAAGRGVPPPPRDFAATGTLDTEGVVGPVNGVVAKIHAALRSPPSGMPEGSIVFYPRQRPANDADRVDDALIARAREERGIELKAVDFIEEALYALGVEVPWWHRDQPPYRALATYQVEHSPIFFGRDDQVSKFLELMQRAAEAGRPGGLVEAASGAGKSSFVQAGVLARLRIRRAAGDPPLEYAVWQPRLAGGLVEAIDEATLAKSVSTNWKPPPRPDLNSTGFSGLANLGEAQTLVALSSALARAAAGNRHRVWVIDQFEELFTHPYTDAALLAFASFLARLQSMGVWIIATLRTEFMERFMALADETGRAVFPTLFENATFPLARMPVEAMRQMITEPARLAGVGFELRADGVRLDALLREEALGANSMPLVGFALNELWLKRQLPDRPDEHGHLRPMLTFDAYKEICGGLESGGIKRVLGIEAERAFGSLPADARAELPRLLAALAVPMEDEEKEAARPAELSQWEEGSPGWRLIEALREARLLVTAAATPTAPAQVSVIHESFFSGWERAREMLRASRDARTRIERLSAKFDEWSKHREPPDGLLSSAVDLELARATRPDLAGRVDLREVLRFVDLSLQREARQLRRRRLAIVGLSLGVVVLAVSLVVAVNQTQSARDSARSEASSRREAQAEAQRARDSAQSEASSKREAQAEAQRANLATAAAASSAEESRAQRDIALKAQAKAVATLARRVIERGDPMSGMLAAARVLPVSNERPWSRDAEAALLEGYLSNREQAVLHGHTGVVWWVGFMPDGTSIVTTSEDGTARIWNRSNPQADALVLKGHKAGIRRARLSSNGHYLVTASEDKTLRLWSIGSGKPVSELLEGHSERVRALDFSPDGRWLVTGSEDQSVRLWDLQSPTRSSVVLSTERQAVVVARFSLDGQRLVTASEDAAFRIWSLAGGERREIATLAGGTRGNTDAAFTPDGKFLATASRDRKLLFWNLQAQHPQPVPLEGHAGWVWRLAFSPDGTKLVTTSSDNSARLWSLNERRWTSRVVEESANSFFEAIFSPDGTQLVAGAGDRLLRVWAVAGADPVQVAAFEARDGLTKAAFSPDGSTLAVAGGDSTARLLRLDRFATGSIALKDTKLRGSVFSPSGNAYVTFEPGGSPPKLWRRASGGWAFVSLDGHTGEVWFAAFDPAGKSLATASLDGTARIWDVNAPRPTSKVLEGHTNGVAYVAFAPDGRKLVTTSYDGSARLWNLADATASPAVLTGNSSGVFYAAFNPDGKKLLTVSIDGAIRCWSIGRSPVLLSTQLARLPNLGLSRGLHKAMQSPDGKWLATSFDDVTLQLWELTSGTPRPKDLVGHTATVTSLAFSRDGITLATGDVGGRARLWDLTEEKPMSTSQEGHLRMIRSLDLSADGSLLATASDDGTTRLWLLRGGSPLSIRLGDSRSNFNFVRFSTDGSRLLTGTDSHGTAMLWDIPSGAELLKRSRAALTRCLTRSQREEFGFDTPLKDSSFKERHAVPLPPCN